jgi:plasmid maintenance system antidote protein VapI
MSDTNWRPSYNVDLMRADLAEKGWLPAHLAKAAGVADMSVYRFLNGEHQTPPMAKKLAKAMRRPVRRYLVGLETASA